MAGAAQFWHLSLACLASTTQGGNMDSRGNFTRLLKGRIFKRPHRRCCVDSGGGAGKVFVFGLLGDDLKRGGNVLGQRAGATGTTSTRSHRCCHGGRGIGAGQAFVVGLLVVDDKRGQRGATGATSKWSHRCACCSSWMRLQSGSRTCLAHVTFASFGERHDMDIRRVMQNGELSSLR